MKSLDYAELGFCLLMLLCGLRPLFFPALENKDNQTRMTWENWAVERWHSTHGNLTKLPLSTIERRFAQGFPGSIARFTDGKAVWVIRHVNETTRMLHPAADCFRGLGYQVSSAKVLARQDGSRWRCFLAERGQKLNVCERIFDAENRTWTDVSAWYWENLLKTGPREWWAVTEVTRADIGQLG